MATYVIGDVQGCFSALQALLAHIRFDAAVDCVWFVGDLVNRGPQSLEVLRFTRALGARANSVLGNHDLHLLAVAAGVRAAGPRDTLAPILTAPDREELLDWLRQRPLLHRHGDWALVHAGLLPQWDIAQAVTAATALESIIRTGTRADLGALFGNTPDRWRDDLAESARWRLSLNAFTRLRYCDAEGRIDFSHKGAPGSQRAGLMPWFEVPTRRCVGMRIAFGHWSALPAGRYGDVVALDSGCVWGRALSALRLEDAALFAITCDSSRLP